MFSAKKIVTGLAVAAAISWAAGTARASEIARWSFESAANEALITGTSADKTGVLDDATVYSARGHHDSFATAVWSTPAGNGSVNAFSSNGWATAGVTTDYFYEYQVSTVGEQNIKIEWDQTGSGTGPRDFKLQYSTDGSTFTDFATYSITVPIVTWNSTSAFTTTHYSYDLSAVTSLSGQAAVYFRMAQNSLLANNTNGTSTVASAGTNRMDNVVITPEPASLALLGLGGLLMIRRRKAA